jgi:hypothetical protein
MVPPDIMVSPATGRVTITTLQQMSYYGIATGLHLHYGDTIQLMRGGTALNIPSSELEHIGILFPYKLVSISSIKCIWGCSN